MLRFLPSAICAAAVVAFVCSVQHDPFFWDTVQLASKHAHHFYENGLAWSPLPAEIDSGHPPFLGWYLAAAWTFFGKTLPVSHWAMLPFLFANVWLLYRLGLRLGGPRWAWWLLPLALLDPVLAGQSALVSPDVVLTTWFLLAVEGILGKNRWFVLLAVVGLCTVSMRGMMTAAALAVWNLAFCHWPLAIGHKRFKILPFAFCLLPFLPGFLLGAAFLWWHWSATGWSGYHSGSPWAGAFERVGGIMGWLRNAAVLGWRWTDFGRWAQWAVLGWLWWKSNPAPGPSPRGRGDTTYSETCAASRLPSHLGEGSGVGLNEAGAGIGSLLLLLALFLAPSALLYTNLSAHRYFLPLFLALHLVVFQQVVARRSSFLPVEARSAKEVRPSFTIRPAVLLSLLICSLATGNLWVYPRGVSMDWDSTLAHLPYHAMRSEAVAFLEKNDIDFQSVGSAFPNLNTGENLLLDGDERQFALLDFEKNQYVLASNIFNDLNEPDYRRLERDWVLLQKWQHPVGAWLVLYRRKPEG